MRLWLREFEVWVFLCLIVVAQSIFVFLVSQDILPQSAYPRGRFYLLASVLISVVFVSRGPKGLLELIRPMFNWKIPIKWYVLAALWAPGLALIVLLVKGLLEGKGLVLPTLDWTRMSQLGVVRSVLIASFIGEIVWVSYAIGQVSKKFSPFLASQIVGLFWVLWWVPVAMFGEGIVQNVPMYAIFISMLAVAANCCFFYKQTNSALCVLLLQSVFNSTLLVFPVIPNYGGVETYTIFSAVYWLVAFVMFNLMGPRPMFERRAALAG